MHMLHICTRWKIVLNLPVGIQQIIGLLHFLNVQTSSTNAPDLIPLPQMTVMWSYSAVVLYVWAKEAKVEHINNYPVILW